MMRKHLGRFFMRTTLDIDDKVLLAAKELARQQRLSTGEVVTRLLRDALTGRSSATSSAAPSVAGFRPFPSRGVPVTDADVNALRDAEGV
jgi:hypothetical protein